MAIVIAEKEKTIREQAEEINRLSVMLHDEISQLKIATDLGQKRWMALNEIVERANQKSADWCRRVAKEGLGLK